MMIETVQLAAIVSPMELVTNILTIITAIQITIVRGILSVLMMDTATIFIKR